MTLLRRWIGHAATRERQEAGVIRAFVATLARLDRLARAGDAEAPR